MWWVVVVVVVDQPITDPISGPSFDFTFTIGPELNNTPSQCSRIFYPSTGSAREEDIAIAMLWFSYYIKHAYTYFVKC